MTKEDMKNKYSAFITEISETLGLGKPVDILKLCATMDLFFQPLENRIADLEKENAELLCQKNRNKSCYSCANATERCFRNEIACPCQKYKSYKEENAELKADNDARKFAMAMSEKVEKQLREENAELRKVAEFQQSTSMSRHFEIKKLKEVLTVGTTWNKGLNSRNKYLEEEMDKYRNMVFDKDDQLTKAKEIIKLLLHALKNEGSEYTFALESTHPVLKEAEQFLKEVEG